MCVCVCVCDRFAVSIVLHCGGVGSAKGSWGLHLSNGYRNGDAGSRLLEVLYGGGGFFVYFFVSY